MKTRHLYPAVLCAVILISSCTSRLTSSKNTSPAPAVINVISKGVFYDIYADDKKIVKRASEQEGLIRISNEEITRKITGDNRRQLSNDLVLKVTLNPLCDNYDRIASIKLVTVDAGKPYNDASAVSQEIFRFTTPFMNKNKMPDTVVFVTNISQLSTVFADKTKDIWIKAGIGGTTSAGQRQVENCKESFETSMLTVDIVSNTNKKVIKQKYLPVTSFYALTDGATDAGNAKNFEFEISEKHSQDTLYFITSAHGAARGGEEYTTREHVLYMDGKEINRFTQNLDCTTYAKYNTQGNGIYRGYSFARNKRSWCPGAAVPVHKIALPALAKGKHSFKVDVPEANLKNGYIHVSAYIVSRI
ncbi:peptide-N-glycosidase F-related protein [Pedobacter frigoris]|uniref:peptide-N-glycosidase F-related protein n=1 Tax=Pedobacter frigoris TaxID=2571272 RepID=UPI00292F62E0|nr:peptide-N-glycosidase F-related protein [Pedobacter frigoris]